LNNLSTAEAGLSGHPDKVADQIGDAVLDAYLAEDPQARVGCQVMLANGVVLIGGQITSTARVDIEAVARGVLADVGYEERHEGVSPDSRVLVRIDPQSSNIASGVARGGAGDSAVVVGFATNETPDLMPLPAWVVQRLAQRIDTARKLKEVAWLRPDGKVQATVRYAGRRAEYVHGLVLSIEHTEDARESDLDEFLWGIVRDTVPERWLNTDTQLFSRATVGFRVGGPKADCGLSGRKVIADTYGGAARHGGGGLSGKDPTKIDRCGMYAARYIAKGVVSAGIADRCEIELAYIIGEPEPVALSTRCEGGALLPEERLHEIIRRVFPLSPPAIVERLRLRRPIYRHVGLYGHFGHEDAMYTWEQCDATDELRASI